MTSLAIATAAALSYSVGGVFMKLSNGYTNLFSAVISYALFAVGVHLQTYLLTRNTSLGSTGILVTGFDALCTVLLGVLLFREGYTTMKMVGIALIVMGTIFLQHEGI